MFYYFIMKYLIVFLFIKYKIIAKLNFCSTKTINVSIFKINLNI